MRVTVGRLALVAGLSCTVVGCSKWNEVKAQYHFREGTTAYQQQNYTKAADEYKQAVELNPDLSVGYFYLANSYDNLYKPSRQGEPENDALLQRALENYKLAVDHETDPDRKKLALQYMVAVYGPDKLNDPDQAEPLIQELIQLDAQDPANYYALAKLFEDQGRYDEAEEIFQQVKQARPNDPEVLSYIAGFYNRQGDFERTIDALRERTRLEPNNPEAYHTLSVYFWEKAQRDFRLNDQEKKTYVMQGLEASSKAIELKPDYMEALVYKNILLRLQANLEKDRKLIDSLIREADQLRDRAEELRKQRAAGVGS